MRFLSVYWLGNGYNFLHKLREFGIKHNRYVNCRMALAGDIAIFLPVDSCFKGMLFYPALANQPFPRSHFHRSENALAKPR